MSNALSDILFKKYFSAFSAHPIIYRGVPYKTIVDTKTPEQAWEVSQKYKSQQVPDFNKNKLAVMEELFRVKLDQHPDVRKALLDSGNALIVKHEPKDTWWGDGPDGLGRNEMGKLWMRLRNELRSEKNAA